LLPVNYFYNNMETTITGLILAGGQSRRMGCDKGLLLLNNKNLIDYPVAILRTVCSNIIISANSSAYNYLGLPVIPDIHESIGPISGLYSGLQESKTAQNIFLACDMPFVDFEILDILMQQKEKFEIIVPSVNNWPLPVCGYYNKAILHVMEIEISKGNFSLHGLLNNCNSLVIEIENESTRNKLMNINTWEEFNQITSKSFI
jgi:molybdenum cofactor guanylyltransferase